MAHRPTHRTRGGGVNIEQQLQQLLTSPFELTQGLTPEEQAGLETLRRAGDPTAQLESARSRFEEFTAPEVISRLSAAGFGRSGAVGSSLARAFAPAAQSIEQQALVNRGRFGEAQIQAGQIVASRSNQARTALLERAFKVLEQIQSLRTAQAEVNANASGVSFAPRQRAFAGSPTAGTVRPRFGASPLIETSNPNFNANEFAQIRANQARIQNDIERQRVPGGVTSIFGTSRGEGAGFAPPGTVVGGPGFGGTITASRQPRLRRPVF